MECTEVTEVVSGVEKASARRIDEDTRDDSKEEGVVRRCLCASEVEGVAVRGQWKTDESLLLRCTF